jgi:hypothetical protein
MSALGYKIRQTLKRIVETDFEDPPLDGVASRPGISPEEVEAGGKLGVPVVFGSSTPSVAVADRGAPVSLY